ncbi:hypothetical protein JL107_07690 [Nakamurella flavida]|uniref:Thiocillin family RiPP n=1 Tax=Nakamurella flavida TaxID=363630 RepID=A0A938YJK4_9ACTN|nr:hypothetical protein [Nakamurella flavida]MBM9476319.1 hypothetical protein [Nakamurella flavida]MDP9779580.1 hypothetical protein [Nakamurella flavida]
MQDITPAVGPEPAVDLELLTTEELNEAGAADGAGWCLGTAGTFGCPSSASSYGCLT